MCVVVFGEETMTPQLGAVSLAKFGLQVDEANRRLVPATLYA
jgi:hypothetical protein